MNNKMAEYFQVQNLNEDQNNKQYGLKKIDEFKKLNGDLGLLLFGMDLPNTGLNLDDGSESIYKTFGSPFADVPIKKNDPINFKMPGCYSKPQAFLNNQFIKKFPEETHFYIFYNISDDQNQYQAVEALYSKGWQYHRVYKTWFRDIQEIEQNSNLFTCTYFNLKKWQKVQVQEIELNIDQDMCTLEHFKEELQN